MLAVFFMVCMLVVGIPLFTFGVFVLICWGERKLSERHALVQRREHKKTYKTQLLRDIKRNLDDRRN